MPGTYITRETLRNTTEFGDGLDKMEQSEASKPSMCSHSTTTTVRHTTFRGQASSQTKQNRIESFVVHPWELVFGFNRVHKIIQR